jgi:hypothetical protein
MIEEIKKILNQRLNPKSPFAAEGDYYPMWDDEEIDSVAHQIEALENLRWAKGCLKAGLVITDPDQLEAAVKTRVEEAVREERVVGIQRISELIEGCPEMVVAGGYFVSKGIIQELQQMAEGE